MDTKTLLDLTLLFIASIEELTGARYVPFDRNEFQKFVGDAASTNPFAAQLAQVNINEGLSLAVFAGFIGWECPTYKRMIVLMPPRVVQTTLKHPLAADALRLGEVYCDLVALERKSV